MADILVQRGRNDIGNTGGTDTGFTAVSSVGAAFEFNGNSMFTHGGNTASGGNQEGDDMSGMIELTAAGTLTFTRQSGSLSNNMRFDWELVEYTGSSGGANEFIIRSRNTITMSGSSGSASLDTTPTNIDKCVPIITGVRTSQTSNNGDELRVLAYINDSGTLIVEKGSTTNTTVVQVVVVEFTGSNWEVYHGTSTSSSDTGSITLNTDSDGAGGSTGDVTDWADAFIIGQFTSTDHGLDSIACRYQEGTGTTTVDWDFNSGNSSSHKHFVHVVRHPDMVVTRYTPSGSNANDTNVDITSAGLTDISEAMIIGTCQGSGGGTAYGRNWRNYSLTSTTNARHYCHRSGNTINHGIQIIDFSAVEAASDTEVSANTDALTLTENQAAVALNVDVSTNVDALTLTEPQATVSLDVDVSTNVDALTLTEPQSTVALDVDISTNVDSLTLTEYQSDVALGVTVDANVDALTLSEQQATIAYDVNVDTNVDSLTITEPQATVTFDVTVNTNVDALTLTENQASVALGINVDTNVDALTLTEQQATLTYDVNVNTNVDSLLIGEPQATITYDVNVLAGVDALSVATQQATIVYDVEILAGTDALTLTEPQASIVYDVEVVTNTDDLTITEFQAGIGLNIDITANVDALNLTEYSASIASGGDVVVQANLYTLSLTTHQPDIAKTIIIRQGGGLVTGLVRDLAG